MSRGTPALDRIIPGFGRIHRRLGTYSREVRAGVNAAITELARTCNFDALRIIRDERIKLSVLYDLWRNRRLDQIGDLDLAAHVKPWEEWARRHAKGNTVDGYLAHVRVLIPEGTAFPRSQFTRRYLSEASAKLRHDGATVRRYLTSWSSFATFLLERDIIGHNPIMDLTWPRENRPREVWLPLEDVIHLVDAQPEPYRTLAALREGTGSEISAALKVRRRDVDEERSAVHLRGTKATHRDREAFVDPWAMERLSSYIQARRFVGDALLFEGITGQNALRVQRKALATLNLPAEYTLHDARHSYAVRKMKAGAEPQLVANNLGHRDATMVLRVYGKYRPVAADIARLGIKVAR